MTNLFSTWLVLLQAVSGFGLPWSTTESSMISLCTTKFVVVDDAKKTSDLTIPYDICRIESPKCFVSMANDTNQLCDGDPIQQLQVETIQKAQFVDMKGNINHISHSSQHFTVSLKREDFTILGIYNYSVSYYYETICDNDVLPSTSCFGWVNLSLIIVVTDVKLTVVNINDVLMLESKEDMTQQTFQVKQGTVNLECSLGLISHRDRELLDMNLRFVFTSAHSDVEKAVSCNESNPQIVDNWVVTPNMNENTCHLKIMNFSKVDDGRYDCLMVLINSHTLYNQDNSNVVVLAAESTLKPSKKQNTNENDFGHLESGLFYFIVSLMVVTVLPLLAISIAVVIRKVRKHRELQGLNHHPAPAPNLNYAYDNSGYGSIGTTQRHRGTDGEVIDLGPDTPCQTELEVETSLSSGRDTDSSPTYQLQLHTTDLDSPRPSSTYTSDENSQELKSLRKHSSSTRPSRSRSSRTRSSLSRSLRPRSSCTKSSRRRKQKIYRKSGTMSEIISDKSPIAKEYKNTVSARIAHVCEYRLVGYEQDSREMPSTPSKIQGTCDSDDKSSLSDISQVPHDPLAEEQDQIIAEDVVTMSRPVGVPSDTNSSGPATLESSSGPASSESSSGPASSESSSGPSSSDLSAGETSPESHYQVEQSPLGGDS